MDGEGPPEMAAPSPPPPTHPQPTGADPQQAPTYPKPTGADPPPAPTYPKPMTAADPPPPPSYPQPIITADPHAPKADLSLAGFTDLSKAPPLLKLARLVNGVAAVLIFLAMGLNVLLAIITSAVYDIVDGEWAGYIILYLFGGILAIATVGTIYLSSVKTPKVALIGRIVTFLFSAGFIAIYFHHFITMFMLMADASSYGYSVYWATQVVAVVTFLVAMVFLLSIVLFIGWLLTK